MSHQATTPALGIVLPSNSPGVHGLWLPVLALQVGLILKPGSSGALDAVAHDAGDVIEAGIPKRSDLDLSGTPTMRVLHDASGHVSANAPDLREHEDRRASTSCESERCACTGPDSARSCIGDDVVDDWESLSRSSWSTSIARERRARMHQLRRESGRRATRVRSPTRSPHGWARSRRSRTTTPTPRSPRSRRPARQPRSTPISTPRSKRPASRT